MDRENTSTAGAGESWKENNSKLTLVTYFLKPAYLILDFSPTKKYQISSGLRNCFFTGRAHICYCCIVQYILHILFCVLLPDNIACVNLRCLSWRAQINRSIRSRLTSLLLKINVTLIGPEPDLFIECFTYELKN